MTRTRQSTAAWYRLHKLIPTDKRIAVVVSGGWDSAVLWYMTKKICVERKQECNPFTVPKIDGAEHYANKVLEWSCNKLGIPVIKTNIVGQITSENPSDYVTSGAYEIFERDLADYLLNGMNAYPPNQRDLLPEGYPMPNDRWEPKEDQSEYVGHPFANMTKDETIHLGFWLGIAEDIMPITHSCTERDRGRCNSCWWCKEREWGFKEIGKVDTGNE